MRRLDLSRYSMRLGSVSTTTSDTETRVAGSSRPSINSSVKKLKRTQYLRQSYLSNRVFETYQDILDAACEAWNRIIDQPWRIMSIGLRQWAHDGQSLLTLVLVGFAPAPPLFEVRLDD